MGLFLESKSIDVDNVSEKTLQSIFSKIDIRTTDECWNVKRKREVARYFTITINKAHVYAHRFIRTLFYGPIPKDNVVMHLCDNKSCLNPSHLGVGTHLDNMYDMHQKGLGGNKKIKPEDVLYIRNNYNKREDIEVFASRFKVKRETIKNILSGRIWKKVGGERVVQYEHLTKEKVLSIRNDYKNGINVPELEKIYDVSGSHISRIIRGAVWKTAGGPIAEDSKRLLQTISRKGINAIITAKDILEARTLGATGKYNIDELAELFQCDAGHMCRILYKQSRTDVGGPDYIEPKNNIANTRFRKYPITTLEEIREKAKVYSKEGKNFAQSWKLLAEEYNGTVAGIRSIVEGRTSPHVPGPIKGKDY